MIDPIALGLETFSVSGYEVQVLCPFHDDHRPSASFNMKKGVLYCYACGAGMKASDIAKELGGRIVHTKSITISQISKDEKEWRPFLYAPQALNHPYLQKRMVTNEQVRHYDIKDLGDCVGFPLKNGKGVICGIQTRRIGGSKRGHRYMLYGEKPPFWPFETWVFHKRKSLLVEGVFGALRLERFGYQTLTTLSCQVCRTNILGLNGRDITVWYDQDFAGLLGAAKLILSLGGEAIIRTPWPPDEVPDRESAERVITSGERTSDISVLAELSGDAPRFWRHINRWRSYHPA